MPRPVRAPRRPTTLVERFRLWSLILCSLACVTLGARASFGAQNTVLVEIGDSAESLLDARATRRLLSLELAEIDVPPPAHGTRGSAPLFFRVLQLGGDLRVELWQRGEYHGARLISGSNAAGQLGARRVALAAAELARRLQKKRQLQTERERALLAARLAEAERAAHRALDGPFALRPSLELTRIGRSSATLLGTRLMAQWTLPERIRLDGSLAWFAGSGSAQARLEWFELCLSPMRRLPVSEAFDLDLGVSLAAAWVRLAKVSGVDGIVDQNETWSARAAAALRVEPRLDRNLRLSLGAEGGIVMRPIPFESVAGGSERIAGLWLGLSAGLVLTPNRSAQ